MNARISKNGTDITKDCPLTRELVIEDEHSFPGVKSFRLFYFNKVFLQPVNVFKHMGGVGLINFFEGSALKLEDGTEVKDLRYVHGRSEVLKGTPSITAVLLAKTETTREVPYDQLVCYLPELYRRFSAMK